MTRTLQSSSALVLGLLAMGGISSWALPAAAADIAVLPLKADAELAEAAFGLESVMRKEVELAAEGTLASREDTVATVAGAKSIGIDCTPTAPACLKQIGELAEAKTLVSSAIKNVSAGSVVLFVGVIDVESGTFRGQAEGPVSLEVAKRQRDVRALVRKAFGLPPDEVSAVEGERPATETADKTQTTEVIEPPPAEQPPETMDPTPLVFLSLGGVGAGLGVVAAAVAAGVYGFGLTTAGTGMFRDVVSNADVYSTVTIVSGVIGAMLLAVGVVSLAVGGGLFAVGLVE